MTKKAIHVVAAVIVGVNDEILIAKRLANAHQGGLWEFPGGKVEPGELPANALIRELQEELGITATKYHPLIQIHHDYPDKSVFLDVWKVTEFKGDPLGGTDRNGSESRGLEGQLVQWVPVTELHQWQFPAANIPIVQAAQLPMDYVITPDLNIPKGELSLESNEVQLFLGNIEKALKQGGCLIQLRTKSLAEDLKVELTHKVQALCESYDATLMLNSDLRGLYDVQVGNATNVGLHLTEAGLRATEEKPKGYRYVSASCHDAESVRMAELLNLDFITLSPVAFTHSHPAAEPLGWDAFSTIVYNARLPVYALGGMRLDDKQRAIAAGAQGIASISAYA